MPSFLKKKILHPQNNQEKKRNANKPLIEVQFQKTKAQDISSAHASAWIVRKTKTMMMTVVDMSFCTSTTRATYLLLEGEDVGDAAVDGVAEARLGLVADGDDGVQALVGRDLEQQLGHVAGAEHLVHRREVRRALLRVEVGREDAAAHALAPEELARAAGPAAAAASPAAAAARPPAAAAAKRAGAASRAHCPQVPCPRGPFIYLPAPPACLLHWPGVGSGLLVIGIKQWRGQARQREKESQRGDRGGRIGEGLAI